MKTTQKVRKILANYESDNPGTKGNPVSYTHLTLPTNKAV